MTNVTIPIVHRGNFITEVIVLSIQMGLCRSSRPVLLSVYWVNTIFKTRSPSVKPERPTPRRVLCPRPRHRLSGYVEVNFFAIGAAGLGDAPPFRALHSA